MDRTVAWLKRLFKRYGIDRRREFILAGALATLAGLALAGLVVLVTGIYSVAASRGHFPWTELLLEIGMRRSVALHSHFVPEPPGDLLDENRVRLGAAHFHKGCAFCHGAPGVAKLPVTRVMLPPPPDLPAAIGKWSDKELYWLVLNGLKYTGMPGWSAQHRGDEVWSVVSFLRRLPALHEGDYIRLAYGNQEPPQPSQAKTDALQRIIADCARCHGDADTPPASNLVPSLAGQKRAYLALALENYASAKRPSGIMEPLAAELDAAMRLRVAAYFAEQKIPNVTALPPVDRHGERIALDGIPERAIPNCVSCHTAATANTFPLLSRQSAAYLERQLHHYKSGIFDASPQGAIMAVIAKRLTGEEIAAVSRYFAARDPREDLRAENPQ